MKTDYDYIIVGAGSAGCALAASLSANGRHTVLLIESGPEDRSQFIHMPRGLGLLLNPGSRYIWEYQVDTGHSATPERWYRGRTLGGSSSVNGMIYMRGAPLDYDGWAAAGCEGWSWQDVLPTFIALEDHDQGAAEHRGTGGPLRITTHAAGDPLCEAILAGTAQMGIPRVADVNDPRSCRDGGIGYQTSTTHQGKRFSSAQAFLTEAKRRANFTLAVETDVERIVWEGKRATGVHVRDKQGRRILRANREIILSAGAIETPKLLQLSGVGASETLRPLGIEMVAQAPDVGANLREHRHVDHRFRIKSHSQNRDLSGLRAGVTLLRYMLSRTGPMSHAAHEVGGFAKSLAHLDHADLQFGIMMLSSNSTGTGMDEKITLDPFPGLTFVTYFTRPESQGEVTITSADPAVAPRVRANHLSAAIDRERFITAFRWNRDLASQPALRDWIVEETSPGPAVQTDEHILANAMAFSGTCFHTAGTARMGTDDRAVVDPWLKVRGVEGLRVADTSIMPTLVSGNTNGPAMMIGLRAAEFITADS